MEPGASSDTGRGRLERLDSGISSSLSMMSVSTTTTASPPARPRQAVPPQMPPKDPQLTIVLQLQLGLVREVVQMPMSQINLQALKKLALQIIEQKAPNCTVIGQGEKVLLFRHEPASENLLCRLSDSDTLCDGDLVEVVLSGSAFLTEIKFRPHSLVVQSYHTPTFCHHCGEMLWGLVRQGLKCEGCGLDFHKRCALNLPNDCSRTRRRCGPSLSLFQPGRPRSSSLSAQIAGSLEEISMSKPGLKSRPVTWVERFGMGQGEGAQVQIPHTFHIHTYTKPTACHYCHRMLKGLFRQGLQCSDCKYNCHRRCERLVPSDCLGERKIPNGDAAAGKSSEECSSPHFEIDVYVDPSTCIAMLGRTPNTPPPVEKESNDQSMEAEVSISPCFSSNIPLMRVVQSVRHTKRKDSGVLKQGWLLHHTNTDPMRKRHYWTLDRKHITLYQNENCSKYYKELPLSEVLQVRGCAQLKDDSSPDESLPFELVTGTLVYSVFADSEGTAWERAIRQAMMPVQSSSLPGQEAMDFGTQSEEFQDVSSAYQIFSDDVLGSGQFGVVYGGAQRQSGRPVAVKVIDKTRFPTNQETQLRNEVAILHNLSHPGVVLLEGMFETLEYVFVVMEKLHGDMLEMILSSEKGRLPERNTRFLVTQILEALRYLHFKHIAHCDLKPENVLLASPEPFPQVKLCDFGFSRIIGEKSFRRSVVGTPAYLAPEVIHSHGYNRSLDMWAVGVVVYVSLSGTFPFNEDEDINQQITNASFMYPRQPWAHISLEAISLINNLLQVSVKRRFTVGKALGHPWLQNYQLWRDLREFEHRMDKRYLTHEGDEERWRRHAQDNELEFPSHLA